MIRHQLGIGVLLIAASCAPAAMADLMDSTTYTINFTGTGTLPTAGSFTYDPDAPIFTNFLVTWVGLAFDLTSSANTPQMSPTIPSCLSGLSGAAASFALLSGACGGFWGATTEEIVTANFNFNTSEGNNFFENFDNLTIAFNFQPFTTANGVWTITTEATPVPEPYSDILISTTLLLWVSMANSKSPLKTGPWLREAAVRARKLVQLGCV